MPSKCAGGRREDPLFCFGVGVMCVGTRGPLPKRAEDRLRRNKDPQGPAREARVVTGLRVTVPSAEDWWSPTAKLMWRALKRDVKAGALEFINSDWVQAHFIMGELTRYQESSRQNGQVLSSLFSGLTELGTTVGARRRMGIELSLSGPGVADGQVSKVTVMEQWAERAKSRGI